MRQLRRLERMHPDGPEAQVARTYLDWMIELPWTRCRRISSISRSARAILDADHAHLDRIKDRILEFLGVRKLRQDSRGPILCFVGPPGVGKTSLGRSIARAMGREFVRVSLGGVRDEAEIRGHRRTYVGAMPGRIIQGLKTAGTNNPVFMLDEIDKLGADYRGDPSVGTARGARPRAERVVQRSLPERCPFDLSKALFIATANLLDPIPAPLRDRMEVIRLSGYTPEEKNEIAMQFLIPRARWRNTGWRTRQHALVSQLGPGPGSRVHPRSRASEIWNARSRRCAAKWPAEGRRGRGPSSVNVTRRTLGGFLGAPRFRQEKLSREGEVGVVKGLAWTEAGGEVLALEATMTQGKGLTLTGQLGDVMRESGQAALSYARWAALELGVDEAGPHRPRDSRPHSQTGRRPRMDPRRESRWRPRSFRSQQAPPCGATSR